MSRMIRNFWNRNDEWGDRPALLDTLDVSVAPPETVAFTCYCGAGHRVPIPPDQGTVSKVCLVADCDHSYGLQRDGSVLRLIYWEDNPEPKRGKGPRLSFLSIAN